MNAASCWLSVKRDVMPDSYQPCVHKTVLLIASEMTDKMEAIDVEVTTHCIVLPLSIQLHLLKYNNSIPSFIAIVNKNMF